MKRSLAAALALVMALVSVASAELRGDSITATTTSQTIQLLGSDVTIINDSTDTSAWVRVFAVGEPTSAATAAKPSAEIKPGEGFSIPRPIAAVSVITSSSTAVVRFVFWP